MFFYASEDGNCEKEDVTIDEHMKPIETCLFVLRVYVGSLESPTEFQVRKNQSLKKSLQILSL